MVQIIFPMVFRNFRGGKFPMVFLSYGFCRPKNTLPQTLPRCTLCRSRQICSRLGMGAPRLLAGSASSESDSRQGVPQPRVPMGQDILLDLISCGDTGKHTPDVRKNFAIKESHCKCPDAGSLTAGCGKLLSFLHLAVKNVNFSMQPRKIQVPNPLNFRLRRIGFMFT